MTPRRAERTSGRQSSRTRLPLRESHHGANACARVPLVAIKQSRRVSCQVAFRTRCTRFRNPVLAGANIEASAIGPCLGKGTGRPRGFFREIAYYGHDSDANPFRPPADLASVLQKWSIYETGEFVHYALEVAFDAVLKHLATVDAIDAAAGRFLTVTAQEALKVTSADLGLGTSNRARCDRTLGDIIEEARVRQRSLDAWYNDPWSENNAILDLDDQPPLVHLGRAFACLVAIHVRHRLPPQPFEGFPSLSPDWLRRHNVTLATVNSYLSEKTTTNAALAYADFLKDYVVGQHLRVAIRKLRYESQSTFKLTIEDGRFVWIENFDPTFTNPRLRQAFRFLRDLGLCSGRATNGNCRTRAESN